MADANKAIIKIAELLAYKPYDKELENVMDCLLELRDIQEHLAKGEG